MTADINWGAIAETLNDKADRDLKNINMEYSPPTKEDVINLLTPDYSAGVSIAFNTNYNSGNGGYIHSEQKTNADAISQAFLEISGAPKMVLNSGNNWSRDVNTMYIPKNKTYTVTKNSVAQENFITFYPILGD